MEVFKKIVVISCLFFLIGGVSQAKAKVVKPGQASRASKTGWLVTVKIKQAVFKHVSGSRYTLTIPTNKVGSILFFTDRPARRAFSVNPTHFVELVKVGRRLQPNDPPNMSLVFAKNQIPGAAFAMGDFRVSKGSVTYQLTLLGKAVVPKAYRGPVVVFIDSFAEWWSKCTSKSSGDGGDGIDPGDPLSGEPGGDAGPQLGDTLGELFGFFD